jgi:sugar transferase (PEP-CTERM system associated)
MVCFFIEGAGIVLSVIISSMIISKHGVPFGLGGDLFYRGLLIAFFAQFCMFILDLYDLKISLSALEILFSVTFTTGFVFLLIGLFSYFFPAMGISGQVYYLTGLFIFLFLFIWRFILEVYIERYSASLNVLVVGFGDNALNIAKIVNQHKRSGLKLTGFVFRKDIFTVKKTSGAVPRWDFDEIKEVVQKNAVREIVVAPDDRRKNIPIKNLLDLKVQGVKVQEWPEFYEKVTGKVPIKNLPPSYFVFNDGFNVSLITRILSRITSTIISILALFLSFPMLLLVTICIKIDSRGPIFYTQERVGENGDIFNVIKFRTMVENAEKTTGAVWARENDPRITRVGRILRRYRIDEMPQFINVFKGEMSVIGPRPERPEFVDILEKELPYYSIRYALKPGVTGWAQVHYSYSGTVEESMEKLEYDLFYIKNRSFKLDIFIILKTIKIVILGRGAV